MLKKLLYILGFIAFLYSYRLVVTLISELKIGIVDFIILVSITLGVWLTISTYWFLWLFEKFKQ
jgi:hypothetical protein